MLPACLSVKISEKEKKLEGQKVDMTNEVTAQVKKFMNLYSLTQRAQNMANHAPKVTKKSAPPVVELAEDDEDVWESD
jgi:hypothetical protein